MATKFKMISDEDVKTIRAARSALAEGEASTFRTTPAKTTGRGSRRASSSGRLLPTGRP